MPQFEAMDDCPYREFLDDPDPGPLELMPISLEIEPSATANVAADNPLRLLNFDNEFAVAKPDPRANPFAAINALLKAVYTAWFDDLNRRLVRGQIHARVVGLAHLSAALAVRDVQTMLQCHADHRYRRQLPDSAAGACSDQLAIRLTKVVPTLRAATLSQTLQRCQEQLLDEQAPSRTAYLWEELTMIPGAYFDLASYLYYSRPLVEQLIALSAPGDQGCVEASPF